MQFLLFQSCNVLYLLDRVTFYRFVLEQYYSLIQNVFFFSKFQKNIVICNLKFICFVNS